VLNVDGTLHLLTLELRRSVKLLTTTEFLDNAGLLVLALELLQALFDVLAFLNWYNDHIVRVLLNDPTCPAPFFTSPFLMALSASGAYHFDKRVQI